MELIHTLQFIILQIIHHTWSTLEQSSVFLQSNIHLIPKPVIYFFLVRSKYLSLKHGPKGPIVHAQDKWTQSTGKVKNLWEMLAKWKAGRETWSSQRKTCSNEIISTTYPTHYPGNKPKALWWEVDRLTTFVMPWGLHKSRYNYTNFSYFSITLHIT